MMTDPLISVITPVGARHARHVRQARASLDWQTIPRAWWEHIVIPDTQGDGPAICRNRGIARARGQFLVCLDADDYLLPTALETYLRAYAQSTAGYIYGDNYVIDAAGMYGYSSSQEYDQAKQATYNQHVVTGLIPTAAVRAFGGFDEGIDAWEDWAFWLRAAIAGVCGERIPVPCLVYRVAEGDRMARFMADKAANLERMAIIVRRYANTDGRIAMAGCNSCGGGDTFTRQTAREAVQQLPGPPAEGAVRLEYLGLNSGSILLRSPHTRREYKLARGRMIDVLAQHAPVDVPWLENKRTGDGQPLVRRVPIKADFVPPPILDLSVDVSLSDLEADAILETV